MRDPFDTIPPGDEMGQLMPTSSEMLDGLLPSRRRLTPRDRGYWLAWAWFGRDMAYWSALLVIATVRFTWGVLTRPLHRDRSWPTP